MNNPAKIYCIYNAEGSIFGEIRYIYDKYVNDIKCAMCDITHNSFIEKSEWEKKCREFPIKIECLHLDELPSDIKNIVKDNAPCVVAKTKSINELIIRNEELTSMNGNVNSFFDHLHKIIKH